MFLFLEGGKGNEKEKERNIEVQEKKNQSIASCMPPTRDLVHNPGMCPDRELNRQTFDLWDDAQLTEPH